MAVYFRNQVTGEVGAWIIQNGELVQTYSLGDAPLNWSLVGVNEVSVFPPDGFAQDLLWQNEAGVLGLWNIRSALDPETEEPTGEFVADPYVANLAPTQGYSVIGTGPGLGFFGGSSAILYNEATGGIFVSTSGVTPFGDSLASVNIPLVSSSDTSWRPQIVLETGVAGATGDDTATSGPTFVWRNSVTNDVGVWIGLAEGGEPNAQLLAEDVSADWQIAGQADFDADNFQDLLWRNEATGEVGIWNLSIADGVVAFEAESVGGIGTQGWEIVGTGNYSGTDDAVATDILFRNTTTGQVGFWDLDRDAEGNITFTATAVETASLDWEILPTFGLGNPVTVPLAPEFNVA